MKYMRYNEDTETSVKKAKTSFRGKKTGRKGTREKSYGRAGITYMLSLTSCIVIAFVLLFATTVKTGAAEQETGRTKYYKSIQVDAGETLWSIAQDNITSEYSDMEAYIREVKAINDLRDNRIYTDQNICVPYYK